MPVPIDTARVNASTAPSILVSCSRGTAFGESRTRIASAVRASTRLAAPPIRASTTLSASSCRMTRARPAPTAARIAISRCLAVARASRTPAMFRTAMSRTRAPAASSTNKAGRAAPVKWSASGWIRSPVVGPRNCGLRPSCARFSNTSSSAMARAARTPGLSDATTLTVRPMAMSLAGSGK